MTKQQVLSAIQIVRRGIQSVPVNTEQERFLSFLLSDLAHLEGIIVTHMREHQMVDEE